MKKLTKAQWEEMKYEWARDNTLTFDILSKKYGVASNSIKVKSCIENWRKQKKEIENDIAENIRKRVIDFFTEAGLPPKELIKMIADGAKETKKLQNVKTEPFSFCKTKKDGTKSKTKPYVLEKTVEVVDNAVTLQYRELAVKMMDLFPAPRAAIKIDGDNGDPDNSHVFNISFNRVKRK